MKKRIKGKLLNVKVLEEKGDYCICEFPTKENRIVFNYELTDQSREYPLRKGWVLLLIIPFDGTNRIRFIGYNLSRF
jgi:hypothetical protein